MKKKSKKHQSNVPIMRIIALIALVAVVLIAVGFVTGMFQNGVDPQSGWPDLEIGSTPSDPIRIAPPTVTAGKKTRVTIGFYNNEQADVPEGVFPRMSCTGITGMEIITEGQAIPVGAVGEYSSLITVPEGTFQGYYTCVINHQQDAGGVLLDGELSILTGL